jgi:hypothetical protein
MVTGLNGRNSERCRISVGRLNIKRCTEIVIATASVNNPELVLLFREFPFSGFNELRAKFFDKFGKDVGQQWLVIDHPVVPMRA